MSNNSQNIGLLAIFSKSMLYSPASITSLLRVFSAERIGVMSERIMVLVPWWSVYVSNNNRFILIFII